MVVSAQPTPLDKNAALRQIEKTNPETLALAYDWEDIVDKVVRTQEKIKECVMHLIPVSPSDLGSLDFHLMNQTLKC
jgi:U3 small nucleolar RNA-associated protein 3